MNKNATKGPSVHLKLALFFLLAACLPGQAWAQESAQAELFGGYSYLRMDPGDGFRHGDLNGWNYAVTYNLTDRLGLVADFAGHYGDAPVGPNALNVTRLDVDQHTAMGGFSFKVLNRDRFNFSVQALAGAAGGHSDSALVSSESAVVLAWGFGGAFDVKVGRRVAIRLFQPRLVLTRYGSRTQESFGVSSGIVFYLGER